MLRPGAQPRRLLLSHPRRRGPSHSVPLPVVAMDPRGPDTSPFMVAWPVVVFWQATIDQFGATDVPPGHGHVYDDTVVTAWSEIVGPPSLPAEEIEAIRAAIADLPE